jgi:hypothetical protein
MVSVTPPRANSSNGRRAIVDLIPHERSNWVIVIA